MSLLRKGIVLLLRGMKSGMRRTRGVMRKITLTSPMKHKNILISLPSRSIDPSDKSDL